MILTLIVLGMVFGSIVWLILTEKDIDCGSFIGAIMFGAVAGVGLIVLVIFLVGHPIEVRAEIVQFDSVQDSVLVARSNPDISQLELAALQHKVVEMNKWLANAQFWAKHPLTNWFWPKKIFELEPIK